MLADLRFNRLATALARGGETQAPAALDRPIGAFLDEHRFSAAFRDWYFLQFSAALEGRRARYLNQPFLRK
jgi:hypothetical protein